MKWQQQFAHLPTTADEAANRETTQKKINVGVCAFKPKADFLQRIDYKEKQKPYN